MRRSFIPLLFAILLSAVPLAQASVAQEATPSGSGLADLGLPTLDVTVTGTGYEGIPDTLEAGRYLVTVTPGEGTEESGGGGVAFVQPPEGMSPDEFLAAAMGPPDVESGGPAAASPEAGEVASPDAGMSEIPSVVFDAFYAGGVWALPWTTGEVVLDLPPGEWVAWADDPFATQEPVIIEVTGEMPADLVEPESAATISMTEYSIEVSEGEMVAGSQVVKVENTGAMPHFIVDFLAPEGTTEEDITTVLEEEAMALETGTPPAYSGLDPNTDLMPASLFTGTQAGGTTIWVPVTMDPGTHILLCFFPDPDGFDHAYHGMYTVVVIAE